MGIVLIGYGSIFVGLAVIGAYYGFEWWQAKQREKERREN